jgi:hypothetical protein
MYLKKILQTTLKVHLHEIFHFKLVWPKEPIRAPEQPSKVFLILASNSPRYSNFRAFRVLSEFGNFPSTYYQTWARSMDLVMKHGPGQYVWTWTCSMDMDMLHEH